MNILPLEIICACRVNFKLTLLIKANLVRRIFLSKKGDFCTHVTLARKIHFDVQFFYSVFYKLFNFKVSIVFHKNFLILWNYSSFYRLSISKIFDCLNFMGIVEDFLLFLFITKFHYKSKKFFFTQFFLCDKFSFLYFPIYNGFSFSSSLCPYKMFDFIYDFCTLVHRIGLLS